PQPLALDELDEREARVGPADVGRKDVQRFLTPVRATTRPSHASQTRCGPRNEPAGRSRDAGPRIRAACKRGASRVAENGTERRFQRFGWHVYCLPTKVRIPL